ncbi:MAG: DNRLRE domain-containing protein, partial [Chloroflexi bacterium]|nr:DNRLRE domain-containing protein [Chloroflexota bacterium]
MRRLAPTPTPTPTPVPTATPTLAPTLTPTATPLPANLNYQRLQQGIGYAGALDTYLSRNSPTDSFHASATLNLRDGAMAALLYFDLNSIPANAIIKRAFLHLTRIDVNNVFVDISAYNILRRWTQDATYTHAAVDDAWEQPDAMGSHDVAPAPLPPAPVPVAPFGAVQLDITQSVTNWVQNPTTNHGILLRGRSVINTTFQFASSEHPNLVQRPYIEIIYSLPTVTPTATITPSPSTTPTASPTATVTPTPTPTPTPSETPSPTPTPTPAPSKTPTATPLPPSATPSSSPTSIPPSPTLPPTPTL